MKKIVIFLLLIYAADIASQSKYDYIWMFGVKGNEAQYIESSQIDFNNGAKIDTVIRYFRITDHNTQISDKNGNLLFYFTGCRIIDRDEQIMKGGDSINYGKTWRSRCVGGDLYPGYQSSIIIPDPGNYSEGRNGYYLIHKRYELRDEPFLHLYTPDLLYSYIDMDRNNGRGEVLYKNRVAFSTTNINYGYMTGCKHANGRDWWILQSQRLTNKHFSVLVTADSVYCVDSLSIGDTLSFGEVAQATFTPDGSKYLTYNDKNGCLIFDFDRSTGELSNYRNVVFQDSAWTTGIAVSPNSRFAYLSADWDLYQIDLWADDIQSSLVHIDHWDENHPLWYNGTFGQAQLAPDCRIYIVPPQTNHYLHVINKPNEKGKACDFQQHAIPLLKTNWNGSLPNYPHFRIDEDQICDPTIVSIFDEPVWYRRNLELYPNPSSGIFHISLPDAGAGKLVVFNMMGQLILERTVSNIINEERIDISHVPPGQYNIEFWPEKVKERVFYGAQVVLMEN